jgi:hypothetical protein
MKPIENKRIIQELKTGIHLVSLNKVGWAFDPTKKEKTILSNKDGDKGFEVVFVDLNNKSFKNIYWVGGVKQKFFEKMLSHIGSNPKKPIKAKEMIGKQIWIAVCEVVEIIGDQIQIDINNEEVKEYYIFKTFPFKDIDCKPFIEGDPSILGVPQFEFRKYKEIQPKSEIITSPVEMKAQKHDAGMSRNHEFLAEEPVKVEPYIRPEKEEPNFGDDKPVAKEVKKPSVIEEKPTNIKATGLADCFDDEPNF